MFIQFRLINSCHECNDKAAFLHHAVGTRECVFTDRIQHDIDIFRDVLELCFGVIDRHIRAELFEQILVRRRCGRDDFRPTLLRDLNGETTYAARSTVNENRLTLAQLRGVDQCLPRRQ